MKSIYKMMLTAAGVAGITLVFSAPAISLVQNPGDLNNTTDRVSAPRDRVNFNYFRELRRVTRTLGANHAPNTRVSERLLCGLPEEFRDRAFPSFCTLNGNITMPRQFFEQRGLAAPAVIRGVLAHEYGHAITWDRNQYSSLGNGENRFLRRELVADCVAGAYSAQYNDANALRGLILSLRALASESPFVAAVLRQREAAARQGRRLGSVGACVRLPRYNVS